MTETFDAIVVGGGAAGIAAARRLISRNRSVLLLEALDRLGGRARTLEGSAFPLDLGCGWLHSAERNPLARLASDLGETIDRREGAWQRQLNNADFPPGEQRSAWESYEAFQARLTEDPPASDRAADAIPPNHPWRPFIDTLSSLLNGAGLEDLSARDFMAYENEASDENWRLPHGLGAFIARLGAEIPHRTGTPVRSIAETGRLVVGTDQGGLTARTAIVTVSTAILARGDLRLPSAAADHLHAASSLPLGLADKLFLELDESCLLPPEAHLFGDVRHSKSGSYYIRPFGRPLIEAFLGGDLARELEAEGMEAATGFAVGELKRLLGSDIAKHLKPIRFTAWGREPTIGGSYSHALPGEAHQRAKLAEPVSDRLCFAGEACSAHDFSTAHGAWESGIAAADWVNKVLGASRP